MLVAVGSLSVLAGDTHAGVRPAKCEPPSSRVSWRPSCADTVASAGLAHIGRVDHPAGRLVE
jgi:hypothetical protein